MPIEEKDIAMDVSKLEYPKDAKFPYPFHDTGIKVIAMTYTGNPWDIEGVSDEPFEVRGTLLIRPSPFEGYQCSVRTEDGIGPISVFDVDPQRVRRE